MLLVAGRLEAAGLDQRKLPSALLPGNALAASRAVTGPDPDWDLPQPPPDAGYRVARLWASTDVALPHGGTAVDALREGLHMFASVGVDVRTDPVILLPALYAALLARDDEQLEEAGERAEAWAWSLPEDSPLVPVTDVMITALRRGLSVDATLGHLFAVPAFAAPVSAADRRFTSEPGTALVSLAFEMGHRQVITRDSKIMPLDHGGKVMLDAQVRAFEEKLGRPPVRMTPSSSTPTPMNPAQSTWSTWRTAPPPCCRPWASVGRGSTPTSTPTGYCPDRTAASTPTPTDANGKSRSTGTVAPTPAKRSTTTSNSADYARCSR
jgi:hypothetical protein